MWGMMMFDWDSWRFEEGIEKLWKLWVEFMNVMKKD